MCFVALVFLHAAHAAWTTGDPPPISLFWAREIVRIVEVNVVSGRQNGTMRHVPQVSVLRDSGPTDLKGLTGSFYDYRRASAEAAIAGYVAGEAITVTVSDGAPYADRIDWFRLGAAMWMTLFASASVIVSISALLLTAGSSTRQSGRRRPSSPRKLGR